MKSAEKNEASEEEIVISSPIEENTLSDREGEEEKGEKVMKGKEKEEAEENGEQIEEEKENVEEEESSDSEKQDEDDEDYENEDEDEGEDDDDEKEYKNVKKEDDNYNDDDFEDKDEIIVLMDGEKEDENVKEEEDDDSDELKYKDDILVVMEEKSLDEINDENMDEENGMDKKKKKRISGQGEEGEREGEGEEEGEGGVEKEEDEDEEIEEKSEIKTSKKEFLSSMPLVFADKVNTSKMIIECDDDNFDLSGDIGSIGRICFKETKKNSKDKNGNNSTNLKWMQSQTKSQTKFQGCDTQEPSLYLDLKGITYKTDIIPSNSLLIVNLSNSQAKVETLANSFVQLTEEQNFNNMETMLQGNLDGYFLASDDENVHASKNKENNDKKINVDDNNNNNTDPSSSKSNQENNTMKDKPKTRKRSLPSEGKIKPTKPKPSKKKTPSKKSKP